MGIRENLQKLTPETGKVAFQLRLYDPRINRWISPDPYGQFHSPYLAMDNRPNMLVDPDGGCTVGVDCPKEFDNYGQGTIVLDEIIFNASSKVFSIGIPWESAGFNFRTAGEMFQNVDLGSMKPSEYNLVNQ